MARASLPNVRTLGSGEGALRAPFEPLAPGRARPLLPVAVRLVVDHLHRAVVVAHVVPLSEAERYGHPLAVARHQRRHGDAPNRAGRVVDDLPARHQGIESNADARASSCPQAEEH